jgi:hypothetical protein
MATSSSDSVRTAPETMGPLCAFEIVALSPDTYEERRVGPDPMLSKSGRGWNAEGMHHVDVHSTDDGRWLACVDGWIKRPLSLDHIR